MSLIINNILLSPDDSEQKAISIAKKKLGNVKAEKLRIRRKSIDTRKVDKVKLVYSVEAFLSDEKSEQALCKKNACFVYRDNSAVLQPLPKKVSAVSPVVVGFGPAGMFAALSLAQAGYNPVVIERGSDVDTRSFLVEKFWCTGELSQSNVQFGEGGAGTFSDGKLTTGINDKFCDSVLETFVQMGAKEKILTMAKPHIGTDTLRNIVKNIRKQIISLGGKVLFDTTLTDVVIKNGKIVSVITSKGEIQTDRLILAIGHSARDTQQMLLDRGVAIEQKAFSAGVRLEQLQSQVDKAMYGDYAGHPNLPAAEYKLSYRENGRGVYSFCMCPGGYVVGAASEQGGVVTNGMSYSGRDGENANSAIVVSVLPSDFESKHPLAGVKFQQMLESRAFEAAGKNYSAPVQKASDFVSGAITKSFDLVKPTYRPGTEFCDLNSILPDFISDMIKKGLYKFDSQKKGFDSLGGILTGVETRTSSPVRIVRDETFLAKGLKGLYPCGEGAGYAGGIMSAACDGLRVANQIFNEEN